MPPWRSLLGALAALAAMADSCRAGALTEIPAADGKQKPLPVYLARPPGPGPFPAVVLLHGCSGLNSSNMLWADRLASWRYAALAIDSLTSRGKRTGCRGGLNEQPHDAYQGLKFLASQPFVRADRVAVMGNSRGGGAVLAALERGLIEPMFPEKFRAGIALYPPCEGMSGIMTAPALVLIGELDDWTPAAACRQMAAGESGPYASRKPGDRSTVELVVYPNAHHAFDVVSLPSGPGLRV